MNVSAFFTANLLNPGNLAILSATSGRYSHVGFLFSGDEKETRSVLSDDLIQRLNIGLDRLFHFYFESIPTIDENSKKGGVRGPYDFTKVRKWRDDAPRTRRLAVVPFEDFNDAEIRKMVFECLTAVPEIGYAQIQLMRNWVGLRLGRGVPLRARSRYDWTCVEFVVRVIAACCPRYAVRYLSLGDVLLDEYVPSGRRGPGLYDMLTT